VEEKKSFLTELLMFRSVAGVAGLIARLSAQHGIPYALLVPQRHGRTFLPAIDGKSSFSFSFFFFFITFWGMLMFLFYPQKERKTFSFSSSFL
jgi:hypothetical protein